MAYNSENDPAYRRMVNKTRRRRLDLYFSPKHAAMSGYSIYRTHGNGFVKVTSVYPHGHKRGDGWTDMKLIVKNTTAEWVRNVGKDRSLSSITRWTA
jgi:hypothetical protein